MEIVLNIEREYMRDLQRQVDHAGAKSIAIEGLALFKWAVCELQRGRKIVSADKEGKHFIEITSPLLRSVKRNKE